MGVRAKDLSGEPEYVGGAEALNYAKLYRFLTIEMSLPRNDAE